MSVPEWRQQDAENKLDPNLLIILKEVMGYVDEGWKMEVDITSVEQELQDISDSIVELAMKIEQGEYHKEVIDDS